MLRRRAACHRRGSSPSGSTRSRPSYRVIVTRRPKYACRACEKNGADETAGVIQAPAPAHLVEGGLPTEALVADVVVSKYAWHLPLYRQAQMLATEGISHRSLDAAALGRLRGLRADARLRSARRDPEELEQAASPTRRDVRCSIPGAARPRPDISGRIARDDRPWGGADPPAVAYMYAPGRGAEHAVRHLAGFSGILQVDGYVAYKR